MKLSKVVSLFIVCSFLATSVLSAQSARNEKREAALQRLQTSAAGAMQISKHKATGAVRFLRLESGASVRLGLSPAATTQQRKQESITFFRNFGEAVGVSDADSLQFVSEKSDALGETHLTWKQFHGKVPVYAGTIKTHFDSLNQLKAVTGTAIPDIAVDPNPRISSKRAASTARKIVISEHGSGKELKIGSKTLFIYREGLARGVEGRNHLAWEIEVTNRASVRDFVYVDAHTGKFIDKINGIQDDLFRRAYDGHNLNKVPNNYPNGPYWVEGQPFPTASQEANNMIIASEETYNLFNDAFGRDSFDGEGGIMDQIFNRGYQCPNASWNGIFISFCPGFTTDDVTTHEWGHAYTQYTHGLIYAWQPGALNESYSDIWGETVDRINGRGTDTPDPARNAG
ncbi:MAG TPA: hypothetical protein VLH08_21650, partial [Acidobacteriota bacterium]|nr:hypothetical protein [Acidobacteriota bacterium]